MNDTTPAPEATAANAEALTSQADGTESEAALNQGAPKPSVVRRNRWRSWLLQALLVLGVYFGVSAYNERSLLAGAAPGFVLRDLAGNSVSLQDFRGKRVLLHFWATWCGVCLQEFGALNDVAVKASPNEVVISVVSDADDVDKLRQFVKANDIRYPVLLASDQVIEAYAVRAFPTNYFLDEQGIIVSKTVGMSTRFGMKARLAWAR